MRKIRVGVEQTTKKETIHSDNNKGFQTPELGRRWISQAPCRLLAFNLSLGIL